MKNTIAVLRRIPGFKQFFRHRSNQIRLLAYRKTLGRLKRENSDLLENGNNSVLDKLIVNSNQETIHIIEGNMIDHMWGSRGL